MSSKLKRLAPFIDQQGFSRVGGRLHRADLPFHTAHPLILGKHPFTTRMIQYEHNECMHAGIEWLHYHLRRVFWIIASKQTIRTVVSQCIKCRRYNVRAATQQMASLPLARVQLGRCFKHTGVDYAGPITVKLRYQSKVTAPAWICLFTCMVSRAVHIELVMDNTTQEFLMALRRFANCRGLPEKIYSDNAATFTGAKETLYKTLEENNAEIKHRCDRWGIEWNFSPPYESHFGGAWERLVKAIKIPYNKIVGRTLLTPMETLTVLKELEGRLNMRPLQPVAEEGEDAITPFMLMMGQDMRLWPTEGVPPGESKLENIKQRWKARKTIIEQVWEGWKKSYLLDLQTRHKWLTKRPKLRTGDLVLVGDLISKRKDWPLARIVELYPGADGLVRKVRLICDGSYFIRGITNLFPLELPLRQHEQHGNLLKAMTTTAPPETLTTNEPKADTMTRDGQERAIQMMQTVLLMLAILLIYDTLKYCLKLLCSCCRKRCKHDL